MAQKTITVNRDSKDPKKLTLDPSTPLVLEKGDWVEWQFYGLNQGDFGFISFAPEAGKFGPFYSLRSHGNDSFLGKGNKGEGEESYEYVALILNLNDPQAVASGTGTVRNCVSQADTTPEIRVTYDRDRGTFTVDPERACLNVGDTATWRFEGVEPSDFVCFSFGSETAAGVDGTAGPFVAFNACQSAGAAVQESTVQASGMGFVAAIPPYRWSKTYRYSLQLRDWQGNLLASHDPIIDNLGPPAPE